MILKPGVYTNLILITKPGYERDIELERRKNRDLMESAKDKDTEYQKLKVRRVF